MIIAVAIITVIKKEKRISILLFLFTMNGIRRGNANSVDSSLESTSGRVARFALSLLIG